MKDKNEQISRLEKLVFLLRPAKVTVIGKQNRQGVGIDGFSNSIGMAVCH